ncbi:MAG: RNA-binding S4 domain-containing protein [Burkholderiaceae bacterium]|nr:RNA-binding S4 domain-containing protein [Burkholderiaceae bacterium]
MNDVRIDKWLWAARFFKTRGLAQDAIDAGRVLVGEVRVKPSRAVHVGDVITLRTSETPRTVVVQGVSGVRAAAPVAQALYQETPDSIRLRVQAQAQKALAPEPAQSIDGGRPTKRERRAIDRWREAG